MSSGFASRRRLVLRTATLLAGLAGIAGCQREERHFTATPMPADARAQADALAPQQAGPAGRGMREVAAGRSFMALTKPPPAVPSRASRSLATIRPAHPPTPASTATYWRPSPPRYETGWPTMPDTVLNFQSGWPFRASTALNQPSIVP